MPRVMLKLEVVDRPPKQIWLGLKFPLQRLMKNSSKMNQGNFQLLTSLQQESIPSQRRLHLQSAACWKLISLRICLIFMKKSMESDLLVKQLLKIVWIIRLPSSPKSPFRYCRLTRNNLRLGTFMRDVQKQLRMGKTSSLLPIRFRTSLAFQPCQQSMKRVRICMSLAKVVLTSPVSCGNFSKASSRNSDILRKNRNCLRLISSNIFLSCLMEFT